MDDLLYKLRTYAIMLIVHCKQLNCQMEPLFESTSKKSLMWGLAKNHEYTYIVYAEKPNIFKEIASE